MGEQADWIKWAGGKCPLGPEVRVKVKFRNETLKAKSVRRSVFFNWDHIGSGFDIIAYRVVRP